MATQARRDRATYSGRVCCLGLLAVRSSVLGFFVMVHTLRTDHLFMIVVFVK